MYDFILSFLPAGGVYSDEAATLVQCAQYVCSPELNDALPEDLKTSDLGVSSHTAEFFRGFISDSTIAYDMAAEHEQARVTHVLATWHQQEAIQNYQADLPGNQHVEVTNKVDNWADTVDRQNRKTMFKLYIINPDEYVWGAVADALENLDEAYAVGYEAANANANVVADAANVNANANANAGRIVEMRGVNLTFADFDWAFKKLISHAELDASDKAYIDQMNAGMEPDPDFISNRAEKLTAIAQHAAIYDGELPKAEIRLP